MNNLILVAAISNNNVIGYQNALPWHLPKDLEHFKQLTLNHNVVMGKNTFLSILNYLGKPLPNRKNIVISSTLNHDSNNIEIYKSLEDFYQSYQTSQQKLYIIGGESIYKQTINKANQLIITHVDINCQGDAFFPHIDTAKWQVNHSEIIQCKLPFIIKNYIRNEREL